MEEIRQFIYISLLLGFLLVALDFTKTKEKWVYMEI